jgi:hypothetical protein
MTRYGANAEGEEVMSQIGKRGIRIVAAMVLAATLLVALLLTLQAKLPSQAASSESIANSPSMSNDILPEDGAYLGVVIPLEQLDAFECMVGRKHKVIKIYQHFHNGGFYEDFADFIHRRGALEFLSFDPVISEPVTVTCDGQTKVVSRTLHPSEILSGAYDGTITQFARQIKEWGHPMILSFAGEMNGCWCPPVNWQGCYNRPNGSDEYVQMYRYVQDIFAAEGVTNVLWAWVVNHEPFPDEAWNQFDNYYPGDEYVDIISIDGYNWGDDGLGGCPVDAGWKTFDQVFSAALTSLSSTHYPTKPFIIGEFASVEGTDPMSKAHWISDAYSRIKTDWPQIKAAIWFNLSQEDCSFPIESSPESIRAYREAIADPHFVGDSAWCFSYLPLVLKQFTSTLPLCTDSGRGGTETITIEPSSTIKGIHIDLAERALQDYGFSLWEVELYGPGTGNLAIDATAKASSWQDSPGCYDCSPDKAIDGEINTRWGSDWSEPQWLSITFASPLVINRIVLKWEAAYAKKYCVTAIE